MIKYYNKNNIYKTSTAWKNITDQTSYIFLLFNMLHVWMIETFTPNMTQSNGKHTPAPWILGNQIPKWSSLKIWSWNHQIQISPTYYPIDPHAVGHILLYSSVSMAIPPFSSIILQVITSLGVREFPSHDDTGGCPHTSGQRVTSQAALNSTKASPSSVVTEAATLTCGWLESSP